MTLVEAALVPEQRQSVIELLHAVDRLSTAERALHDAVSRRFGRASAQAFDHSRMADIVGVFSRDVEVVDEKVDGDRAVVTVQVAGRVPLEKVNLVVIDGQWRVRTDPPIPGLAAELNRLADAFASLARRASDSAVTIEELRRELDARAASVLRRIRELTGNSPSATP